MSKIIVKKWILDGTEDPKKLAARLITIATVLLLIFAGSPFANINTNKASAQTNPYASVGTIVVNTNNTAANFTLTGPANYTGNGTSWSQADAPIGNYTITFNPIPGYDTPASDTQTLVNGGTITFTGLYNLSVGTITVTTNNSAATFTVTGPATYTGSGTTWSQADAPIGTYTITFNPIPGYDTPTSDTQFLVSKGTIAFIGTYNLSVGTIIVTTNNSAATFNIAGPANYTGSGTSWSQTDAPIGTYTITYGSVAGYSTPASDTKTIVNSGDTISFTGAYTPLGTITVTTNNAAATFNITGPANYSGSGTSWSQTDSPAGTYTITFNPISGFSMPASDTKTIINSGDTIAFTGSYNPLGTITVTTNNAAATFTITGPATYSGTGTRWSQADAPAGTYTITYGSVAGYDTPASSSQIIVNSGDTIDFTGTYTKHIYTAILDASADTYIDQKDVDDNYGGNTSMYVQSKNNQNIRSLIKFDTSILPTSSAIISATLNINAGTVPSSARTYLIKKVTTSWIESDVTWGTQPSVVSTATSSNSTPASPGWMIWTVTPDVQSWINSNNNYGWQISDASEDSPPPGYQTTFYTKEYTTTGLRPTLVVQYTIV